MPEPFPVSCATLCLSIQQPHNLNTVLAKLAKSPGFKKLWPRYLNLNTTNASQTYKAKEGSETYVYSTTDKTERQQTLVQCSLDDTDNMSSPVLARSITFARALCNSLCQSSDDLSSLQYLSIVMVLKQWRAAVTGTAVAITVASWILLVADSLTTPVVRYRMVGRIATAPTW